MVTNQDIIEAAFILFAQKGFHETTTDNIAKKIGLKKQSLYSHFSNKKEIIQAVLYQHKEQISHVIDEIMSTYRDKPVEMLLKFIFVRLSVYFSQRERLLFWKRIFLFELDSDFGDILKNDNYNFHKKLVGELGEILSSRFANLKEPDKLKSFFISYMALISGYMDWMLVAGYDISSIESTWDNFWIGSKSLF